MSSLRSSDSFLQPLQHHDYDLKSKNNDKGSTAATFVSPCIGVSPSIGHIDRADINSVHEAFANMAECLLPEIQSPAKPQLKPSSLEETCFILPGNLVFVDKILPPTNQELTQNHAYPLDYFVGLHSLVSTPTINYPAYTPNYLGARIPLQHTNLNIPRWRHHLIGYEGAEILQFLTYGFPLGLSDNPPPLLTSTMRNHGSSYQYFSYLDEFLATGLERWCHHSLRCMLVH